MPFTITDASLKRAGMDYWNTLDVHHHSNWETFLSSPYGPLMLSSSNSTIRQTLVIDHQK
jgi:tRNA(Leu) C34 or U34 (ribose-2'-O)-methylase TrmL